MRAGVHAATAPARRRLLQLEGLPLRVLFCDADDVEADVRAILRGWTLEIAPPSSEPPEFVVAQENGLYSVGIVESETLVENLTSTSAACCLIVEVVTLMIARDRRLLCLHAAALECNGRLIVLAGEAHAGKSTLATTLAARGMTLFCDDMLPLVGDEGLALGIAPRLRLPIPPAADLTLRDHIARHPGPSDDRYAYVSTPALAPHGGCAPIGAVVVLDRQPSGPASLARVGRSDTLSHLVRRNFARDGLASAILERLHDTMGDVPGYRLTYSDTGEAAALIEATFSNWTAITTPSISARFERPASASEGIPVVRSELPYVQAAGIKRRDVDGAAFLASDGEARIIQLNQMGAAIWALLEVPTTAADASSLIAEALGADPVAVTQDVHALLGDLAKSGFVVPVPS